MTTMARILIVDDEPEIRRVLEQILAMRGYDCVLATSAAEAREYLKTQKFELILSDIKMPGESGLDLISHVRDEYPDTAAIIVTFIDDLSVAEIALEMGVYGFIIKPFRPQGVLISVNDALRRRQLEIDNRIYRIKMEQVLLERNESARDTGGNLADNQIKQLWIYQKDLNRLVKKYRSLISTLQKELKIETSPAISRKVNEILALEREINIDSLIKNAQNVIQESLEEHDWLGKVVSNLQTMADPAENLLDDININETVESALDEAWPNLKNKAEVIREYGNTPLIRGNARGLNLAVKNILINAGQAIEKKGQVRIETSTDDKFVSITISDTGHGIPKESLSKIYDPFFTTKNGHHSIGLGLNIVHNIIRQHKGTIEVQSELGRGSIFTLRIPIDNKRSVTGTSQDDGEVTSPQ